MLYEAYFFFEHAYESILVWSLQFLAYLNNMVNVIPIHQWAARVYEYFVSIDYNKLAQLMMTEHTSILDDKFIHDIHVAIN